MKFSIIIPIYGVDLYLRQCLDSILAQTYKEYEVILVDDGSKDNCPQICDDYVAKDNRFKVIHKANCGRVDSRQVGVKAATGDFIVCVDGDDWVSPNFLSHFAVSIDQYNPDILICDYIYAYPDKYVESHSSLKKGFYRKTDIEQNIYPNLIYPNPQGQLWAKAFRRNIYQSHQLVDVVVEMGEDRACVIPTIYHSSTLYVSDYCDYYYRQVPTSITKSKKVLNVDGPRLIYDHLKNHLELDKFDFANQLYQGTCHSLFNVCKSQFYSTDGYFKLRKKIAEILNDSVYKECIKKASFKGSFSRKLMHLSLKYRLYSLMYLYSRIK